MYQVWQFCCIKSDIGVKIYFFKSCSNSLHWREPWWAFEELWHCIVDGLQYGDIFIFIQTFFVYWHCIAINVIIFYCYFISFLHVWIWFQGIAVKEFNAQSIFPEQTMVDDDDEPLLRQLISQRHTVSRSNFVATWGHLQGIFNFTCCCHGATGGHG